MTEAQHFNRVITKAVKRKIERESSHPRIAKAAIAHLNSAKFDWTVYRGVTLIRVATETWYSFHEALPIRKFLDDMTERFIDLGIEVELL